MAARDSHQTIPNDIYKKDYLTFKCDYPADTASVIALQRYSLFFMLYVFERYLNEFLQFITLYRAFFKAKMLKSPLNIELIEKTQVHWNRLFQLCKRNKFISGM